MRDYGLGHQLGLDPTVDEYVSQLVGLFREVRRVLHQRGTLWLNLGDAYASISAASDIKARRRATSSGEGRPQSCVTPGGRIDKVSASGLKPKDLLGIPWRIALALQADGWWLRQDIIWSKPNPMPESVLDRCTKSHEYVFLLSKSASYFFDALAIREPAVCARSGRPSVPKGQHRAKGEPLGRRLPFMAIREFRNRRSVWSVATSHFAGAHFATFPEELALPCVRASTSEFGCCDRCGAPWRPLGRSRRSSAPKPAGESRSSARSVQSPDGPHALSHWTPTCGCRGAGVKPCVVLDPFNGAGTTGVVALREGRRYCGIELNPEYVELTRRRLENCGVA